MPEAQEGPEEQKFLEIEPQRKCRNGRRAEKAKDPREETATKTIVRS